MAIGIRRIYFNETDLISSDTTPILIQSIPIASNQTLIYSGSLMVQAGNATSAMQFTLTSPLLSTRTGFWFQYLEGVAGVTDGESEGGVPSYYFAGQTGTQRIYKIFGQITNGINAGLFNITFNKGDATAGNFILLKNSFIEINLV